MRAQTDDDRRRAVATHVIDNDGSLEELRAAVDEVADRIERAARTNGTTR
jgi:dephospho-CoA kinase